MFRAPGEAKNTAIAAMSSGRIRSLDRNSGHLLALHHPSNAYASLLCTNVKVGNPERGARHTRADRVHVDVETAPVAGQPFSSG